MPDPFDGRQYLAHLRSHWRLPAVVLATALASTLVVSLLLPKKYTARVLLVIEPPAGSDVRASTAVSPVYLESLRTYEHLASSDQIFAKAAERFRLRANTSKPLEKLKNEVLRVSIVRNTKVMEITATLPNPNPAHDVALFVAEQTIKLNREANRADDEELIAVARTGLDEARRRLAAAGAAFLGTRKRASSSEALRFELDRIGDLRVEIARLALTSELAAADEEERKKTVLTADGTQLEGVQSHLQSLRNRAARLRREEANLERKTDAMQKDLAGREAELQASETEFDDARAVREQAQKRLLELQSASGLRGERLNILDPGVPPERPSSPNIPLNLFVAGVLGLLLALLCLTIEFGLRSVPVAPAGERRWVAPRT